MCYERTTKDTQKQNYKNMCAEFFGLCVIVLQNPRKKLALTLNMMWTATLS